MANANDKKALLAYQKKLQLIRESGGINAYETDDEKSKIIKWACKDYKFFVEHFFPHYASSECADFHIEFANKVKRHSTFKGFAEWGRGLAKSVHADILIPLWLWINDIPVYLVVVSVSEKKAQQLLGDTQAEFEANPRLIHYFGEQKSLGSWTDGFFVTQGGFIGQALGMGQSVRGLRVKGQRPTLIILDDAETKETVKNQKRQDDYVTWVERDLLPTMDGDHRRFIQANNRFAPRMIQTELQKRHPKWIVHHIKAFDPVTYAPTWKAKYAPDYYRDVAEEIGLLAALAEYNNEPHVEGKIFLNEQIQYCKLPRIDHFNFINGFWDVAYAGTPTGDYNAIPVQGVKDGQYYLIDAFCKQAKMKVALEWMADFQLHLPNSVIVHWRFEAQFWNDEVMRTILEVEKEKGVQLNLVKVDRPKSNKYDRMISMQSTFQNNRYWINEKLKSQNDAQVGISQLLGIEPGYTSKDDFPDAMKGGLDELAQHHKVSHYSEPELGEYEHGHSNY